MPVRKPSAKVQARKGVETAKDRMIADRVARARRANPPRDPTGEHHLACREIADEAGVDVVDVLDTWDERAALREYDGNVTREEAERLAVADTREIYVRQRGLNV